MVLKVTKKRVSSPIRDCWRVSGGQSDSFDDVRPLRCAPLRKQLFADMVAAIGKETAFSPIFGP